MNENEVQRALAPLLETGEVVFESLKGRDLYLEVQGDLHVYRLPVRVDADNLLRFLVQNSDDIQTIYAHWMERQKWNETQKTTPDERNKISEQVFRDSKEQFESFKNGLLRDAEAQLKENAEHHKQQLEKQQRDSAFATGLMVNLVSIVIITVFAGFATSIATYVIDLKIESKVANLNKTIQALQAEIEVLKKKTPSTKKP